ncbi:iron ABC transporter permease [Streptomyces sp. NEAU-S7GS2]|uniref:FecCD family ABC transporter permease n=1 Tax=Streptomyces sp. NEAU-S7GS2 TaxID=2202000 RepID=UPI000D7033FD|nr:iron ABC transporter permease [Streptomyces sp. NEAU-S7GS2]AWN24981.1 ABC transporter permease [Streptomyces sp. NEAU-S7GS2]
MSASPTEGVKASPSIAPSAPRFDSVSVLHPAARSTDVREAAHNLLSPLTPHSALSRLALSLLAVAALVISMAVSVRIGTSGVGYADLGRALGSHLGLPVEPLPRLLDSLIWDLRTPRVLMAAVVGASLAVCGAALQSITRNALADPYLLGVSSGASAGAVVVVLLGIGASTLGITGGAFVGSLVAFGLLMLLLRRSGLDSAKIVLTGVVVGQLFTALTSLVLIAAGDADATRAITYWLLGSMASARWEAVIICSVVAVIGLTVVWLCATALDGFAFGVDAAASLGINVRVTRIVLLVVTALMTSVAVASVGAIGFVGLIVPHGVRFLVGPLHRVLLPFSALVGAVFLVWTDALARVAFAPQEVPVGVFTALLGVPLFLVILRKRGEL